MKVICICDHKGGVGKTATAGAIAQGINARKRPKGKTLLIDTDPQGSATKTLYGVPGTTPGLYEVLKGRMDPTEAIIHTEAGDILPYSKELSLLDVELSNAPGKDFYLTKVIERLDGLYTHIIIDTAPGLSVTMVQALTASNGVIIPINSNADGVESLQETYKTIETVKTYTNKELEILGAVITQHSERANVTRQYEELLEDVAKDLKVPLCKTRIRRSVIIDEARALRTNLFDYAPHANVTKDYEALIKELKL